MHNYGGLKVWRQLDCKGIAVARCTVAWLMRAMGLKSVARDKCSFEAVEHAPFEWVDWFGKRRLLEPIGNIPPAEADARKYARTEVESLAA